MLNSVVVRASRLSLHSPRGTISRKHTQEGPNPGTDTDVGSDSVMAYDKRGGDSSPGFTSDPESNRDFQSSVALPVPPPFVLGKINWLKRIPPSRLNVPVLGPKLWQH